MMNEEELISRKKSLFFVKLTFFQQELQLEKYLNKVIFVGLFWCQFKEFVAFLFREKIVK